MTILAALALAATPSQLLVQNGFSKKPGSVVLVWREGDGALHSTDSKLTNLEVSPCSTFKIPNAAIALETGKLKRDEIIPWDGKKRWNPDWSRPSDMNEAMRMSNVGFFQVVANRVGRENYRKWLGELKYGNQKMGPKVDEFWLDGSLKISPNRQVELMGSLAQNKWPMRPRVQSLVRQSLKIRDGYYGKTGTYSNQAHSWWVGWISRPGKPVLAFAVLCREPKTMGPTVRDRATKVFEGLGWLKRGTVSKPAGK